MSGFSNFFFFVDSSGDHRDLHSFPTRRSSDLDESIRRHHTAEQHQCGNLSAERRRYHAEVSARSEEHTSELQSRLHLVCRLLLEKKKKKKNLQLLNSRNNAKLYSLIYLHYMRC